MNRLSMASVVIAGVAAAGPCLGDVVYVSQSRSIQAQWCNGGIQTKTAGDFGVFDKEINFNLPPVWGLAKASQLSSLEADKVVALGKSSAGSSNGCSGNGSSDLHVVFEVTEPTPWSLVGEIFVHNGQSASLNLMGPSVNLSYELGAGGSDKTLPIDESGVLMPGAYELMAKASSKASIGVAHWSHFDFALAFDGCYADCDSDGQLAIDDFICFQTLFATDDPLADCDGSGSLNIDDFICFQTWFAMGC